MASRFNTSLHILVNKRWRGCKSRGSQGIAVLSISSQQLISNLNLLSEMNFAITIFDHKRIRTFEEMIYQVAHQR